MALGIRCIAPVLVSLLASLLSVAPVARAQDVWFAFEMTDPASMLSHPKDAGMRASLEALPARAQELAAMFGGEAELAQLAPVMQVLTSPMRIAVTGAQPAEEGAPPLLGVHVSSSQADRDGAQMLVDMLTELAAMQGLLIEGEAGALGPESIAMFTPMGPGSIGVVERNGRFDATLLIGDVGDEPFADNPNPGGQPLMRMRVDFEAASWFTAPLAQMAAADAGPMEEMVAGILDKFTGEPAPTINFAMWRDGDALRAESRMSKAARHASAWWMPEEGLSGADMRAIPAGAGMGMMAAIDFVQIWDDTLGMLDFMPELDEAQAMHRELTGVDLRGELLPAFGPGVGFYTSVAGVNEPTPTMLTMVVGVRDRDTVQRWLDGLAASAGEAMTPLLEQLQGVASVEITTSDEAGARWWVLRAPGLPVPIAPTIALTDRHLIVCFTKTAARAAVAQAMGEGDGGAAARPEVARLGQGQTPVSLFFLDTPSLAPMGYAMADWITTAMASGVDSPSEPRGPGLPAIVPYDEWRSGVRPMTAVTVWDGDDMTERVEMDGSFLTNMASGVAMLNQMGATAGGASMLGILLPALERARGNAMELQEGAQVKLLHTACIAYSAQNDGRFPDDLTMLLEGGFIEPEHLQSPYGPVWDGGPDYFLKPGSRDSLRADELQIYSRAMLAMEGRTAVAFADNYVMTVSIDEFFELISEEANAGVDWTIP